MEFQGFIIVGLCGPCSEKGLRQRKCWKTYIPIIKTIRENYEIIYENYAKFMALKRDQKRVLDGKVSFLTCASL